MLPKSAIYINLKAARYILEKDKTAVIQAPTGLCWGGDISDFKNPFLQKLFGNTFLKSRFHYLMRQKHCLRIPGHVRSLTSLTFFRHTNIKLPKEYFRTKLDCVGVHL